MVIFDLDGTLYKTHETGLRALHEVCNKYNISFTPEDERYVLYTTFPSFLKKAAPYLSDKQLSQIYNELKWYEIELVKKQGRLFDGVLELLSSLSDKSIPMAICGMGSKEYIEAVLTHCKIKQYFKFICHRVEGLTKSQVLAGLLQREGIPPIECIMVGDSITDLTAAKDNDIPFIGVSYGYGADDIKDSYVIAQNVSEVESEIYKLIVNTRIENDILGLNKPSIIGINGVDTSGKTIFSEQLSRYFQYRGYKTQIIHMDDFHNPRSIRNKDLSPQGYIEFAFDLPKLAELLADIKTGNIISNLLLLDLDTDTYSNTKEFFVDRNTIVIIEGVLLYRPPINHFFNYRIYLDIDFDEVLNRAALRDVPKYGIEFLQRYKDRFIPAQKMYLSQFTPKVQCDLIVDNSDYKKPIYNVVKK